MTKTGIGEKSVSEDFEKAFSNFYLSPKTFLGRGADLNETIFDARLPEMSCAQGMIGSLPQRYPWMPNRLKIR